MHSYVKHINQFIKEGPLLSSSLLIIPAPNTWIKVPTDKIWGTLQIVAEKLQTVS